MDRIGPTVSTPAAAPASTSAPAPKTEQPPSAPVDGYAGSVTPPSLGIYKKQPQLQFTTKTTVTTKPDGAVDRKPGEWPTGARGELGTEVKTVDTQKGPDATRTTTATGNLHADGKQDGSVKIEVRHEQKTGSVKGYESVSTQVTGSKAAPEQPGAYNASVSGEVGVEAKKGDHAVGVKFGGGVSEGSKGPGATISSSLTGQTRLGAIYLRGEVGVGGTARDGGGLKPEFFGKIQVGNPKLPVSVQAQCTTDPANGQGTCTGGLGGRF